MSEATTRTGARSAQAKTISRFMKATATIEFLGAEHGDANARKIALKELRKARRARSRRRFDFMDTRKTRVGRFRPQTTLRKPIEARFRG
jgi:hypothetical protein